MTDRDVIQAFIDFRRNHGFPGLRVERWPDDKNRQSPEIDAIAGPFAIEHTSIDSVANQRRDDDMFLRVINGLKQVIDDCVDCGFTITLEYDAIKKVQDWKGIHATLKSWIYENASRLSYGKHEKVLQTSPPIRLAIWKTKTPQVRGFSRFAPHDETRSVRIKKLLDRKAKKLAKYAEDYMTVLLVENNDIALMNDQMMCEAIRGAYPEGLPKGVEQLWYADTSVTCRFLDFTQRLSHSSGVSAEE